MSYIYGHYRAVYIEPSISLLKDFRKRIRKVKQYGYDLVPDQGLVKVAVGRRAIDGNWFFDKKTSYVIIAYENRKDDDYAILKHPQTGETIAIPLPLVRPKTFLTEREVLIYAYYKMTCPDQHCGKRLSLIEDRLTCNEDKHTYVLEYKNVHAVATFIFGNLCSFSYEEKRGITTVEFLQSANEESLRIQKFETPDFTSFYKLVIRITKNLVAFL